MASRSSSRPTPTPTPGRRQSSSGPNSHHTMESQATDLAQSLQQLSIATATSPRATEKSPRSTPLRNFSSSLASPRPVPSPRFSPRSASSMGRDSRPATPTLLRKSSTSSLRSSSVGPRQSLSRRASSANLSGSMHKSPLAKGEPMPEPKPVLTANSVAKDFFKADLQFQRGDDDSRHTDTAVIMHDSCYGHRYSRPHANSYDLASIVERPERLKACALGIAMAYVRLGDRHAEGQHFIQPKLDPATIPNLPFRIRRSDRKVSLLSPPVVAVHGKDTMEELQAMCNSALSKFASDRIEVDRNNKSKPEFNSGDLYLGPQSLEAMEGALGAVCDAVDTAFGPGPRRSFVAVRPPGHHCSADYPSGFCWVNNVHVGIAYAMMNHGLTHAAIIDFDLHHGDGSQAITWDHNHRNTYSRGKGSLSQWKKGSIAYFSLHDIRSYPCESGSFEKTVNASVCIEDSHGQNIWNVHLKPWETKAQFWEHYETRYSVLLEKTESYLKSQSDRLRQAGKTPKAAIFLSAGFDASEWESNGMQRHAASVPTDFYARITQDVVKIASDPQTATDGRIISVMEGGYSDRAIYSGVCSHLSGLVSAPSGQAEGPAGLSDAELEANQDHARLGTEIGQRLGLSADKPSAIQNGEQSFSDGAYDIGWWASGELDALEQVLGVPVQEPKKLRHSLPPTYSTPTHASTARAANPASLHRSLSRGDQPPRPLTPQPPEVPWTVAVQELSKLLIPDDRPTESCTVAEISAILAQARQVHGATPPALLSPTESPAPTPTNGQRMGLRGRRSKPIEAICEEDGAVKSRAKISSAATSVAPAVRRSSRRASMASVPTSVGTDSTAPATESSVSSRGSSRVSDVGGATSLQLKKTRAAAARAPARAPKETVKKPSVKPAPVKRASSTTAAKGKAAAAVAGPKAPVNTSRRASEKPEIMVSDSDSAVDRGSNGLELITSGMNKVKISLANKLGQGTREGAKSAPPSGTGVPGAAAPRRRIKIIQSGQRSIKTSPEGPTPTDAPQPSQPDDVNKQTPGQSPVEALPAPPESPDPLSLPLPASSPAPEHGAPATPDLFVQYQPDGPTPVAVPMDDAVRFLPPNVSATPTPMKPVDLPMFTATSAIPFADSKETSHGRRKSGDESSIWDIPENPCD